MAVSINILIVTQKSKGLAKCDLCDDVQGEELGQA